MKNGRCWSCVVSLGLALGSCALSGCVTEPGRSGPALWSSVSRKGDDGSPARLKHPVRTSILAGQMAERQRRYAVARQHYERALKHNPKAVKALVGLARLDQHDGRLAQAQRGFEKALQLAPEDPDVLYSAGLFFATRQEWSRALRYLQSAVQSAPNNPDYHYGLGVVLAKTGDREGALAHFRTAVGPANAHYNLGHLLYEEGRFAEAARHFEIALTLNPDLTIARQMLARLNRTEGHPRNQTPQHFSQNNPLSSRGSFSRPASSSVRAVEHRSTPQDLGSRSAWENRTPVPFPAQPDPQEMPSGNTVTGNSHSSARAGANTPPTGAISGDTPLWPQR